MCHSVCRVMSSSRPRLKDAPSGIIGEGHTRMRTPSPTRLESPSEPPATHTAADGTASPTRVAVVASRQTGRIPALVVRVLLELRLLNGVDCLHLMRVNRELRSLGLSQNFWKVLLPYSLVERAKGDVTVLQRDFLVVSLPLALAEQIAKALFVIADAHGSCPQLGPELLQLLQVRLYDTVVVGAVVAVVVGVVLVLSL